MKFYRRKDLSAETRMEITKFAYLSQGIYGEMTRLAIIHNFSRRLVYPH